MTDHLHLTDRELDVMSVLWQRGSGTVTEVREGLGDPVGYTGVLKLLQILEEKGAVRHEQEGRAYRYYPVAESQEVGRRVLDRIVDRVFQGSAELAMARLVADRPLDAEAIERLKALLDEAARRESDEAPGEGGER